MVIWPALAAEPIASDAIRFAPRPAYVEAVDPPPFREEDRKQASDGVVYLLLDSQDLVAADRYWSYRHTAKRIIDRAGLEGAGRLEFVFDPSQEEFTVHAIRVIRGDAVIDRLDPKAFLVIRREEGLGEGVTDGELTAYIELPDVRVGDTIAFEASWLTKSPLWPGEYFSSFSVEWSSPVGLFQRKITAPAGKPLNIVDIGAPPPATVERRGDAVTYVWRRERPAVVRGEESVPVNHPIWSSVGVSTMQGWGEVVDSLAPDYERRAVLSVALATRFAKEGDLNQKITAAVRYVQDEIRYVADETGVGSHLPRSPEMVVTRGWGDCKDKALLLAAILRTLGVEAYVALTDSDSGNALPLRAPSPFAFDHAITVAIVTGKPHWIDATDSHQGGVFPNIAPPPVGNALPIKAGVGALWPVESASGETPDRKTTEIFDFAKAAGEGVELDVTTLYRRDEADAFRRKLASDSPEAIAEKYLRYYESLYPGIKSAAEFSVADDRDANAIAVKEAYRLGRESLIADGLNEAFPLKADAVNNILDEINRSSRRAPIALPYPLHAEHVAHLKNTGVEMSGIDEFSTSTAAFEFVRNAVTDDDSVRISWRLKTLQPEASVEQIADYAKVIDEMNDWNTVEYNLAKGEDDPFGVAALVALVFAFITGGFAVWAAAASVKEDAKTLARSVLYPMAPAKFLLVGAATMGLYAVFWMYRCWRQEKFASGRNLSPFWRAFFAIFYFYPLFSVIRAKTPEADKPALLLGGALAALFAMMSIVASIYSGVSEDTGAPAIAGGCVEAFTFMLATPLLYWTNRLNRNNPEIVEAHSRWTARTFAALAFGLSCWALVVIGAYTAD